MPSETRSVLVQDFAAAQSALPCLDQDSRTCKMASQVTKDPRYFYEVHLVPNYSDWDCEPLDERRAMNAVVSANQMADWAYSYWLNRCGENVYNSRNTNEYRQQLAQRECESFALLRDIAECHKHLVIHRANRQLSSIRQIRIDDIFWFGPELEGSREFVVELDDGGCRSLFAIAYSVEQMWQYLLARWKI